MRSFQPSLEALGVHLHGMAATAAVHDVLVRPVGRPVADVIRAGASPRRYDATVVFVDVVGSTALAEHLAPERYLEVLNELFAALVEIVEDAGGWVDKFQGDGAL